MKNYSAMLGLLCTSCIWIYWVCICSIIPDLSLFSYSTDILHLSLYSIFLFLPFQKLIIMTFYMCNSFYWIHYAQYNGQQKNGEYALLESLVLKSAILVENLFLIFGVDLRKKGSLSLYPPQKSQSNIFEWIFTPWQFFIIKRIRFMVLEP